MYITLVLIITVTLLIFFVINLPVFGKLPTGKRLNKIKNLSNYLDGEIKNLSLTPVKPEDVSYWQMLGKVIEGNKNGSPKKTIPHQIPDFTSSEEFKITWFGHSSYLIQVDGKNILVDPVFSKRTSPFQFLGTKGFEGTDFIKPEELPNLDIILITHDHYDHLDYNSILKLKNKTKYFLTSLGVGSHLENWGILPEKIIELAWGEEAFPLENISFTAANARHFSGRLFKRNRTAWSSFILKTKNNKIYLGGDSGYDTHFKIIGETYGPFDLAILECGQYNAMWPLIHMVPEEVTQASLDLNAKHLLPVHWGKYRLALHDWDDSIKRVVKSAKDLNISILTPELGQTLKLKDNWDFKPWWANL
ncbi:MBL fold metallo-hydrolase [Pedobacter polaris]|uniref:MBL fold metallo-hydrolase n=1 Tax=Pedobacter polaris TaxID=2571273 RepID=A0A4U1CRE3_9SPHI|nr:MBL fold metallo-hydrolase [Pedobacter polaris]TKC10036.1 MBL fold metallo-hydrolase [Pedobacter polaris]